MYLKKQANAKLVGWLVLSEVGDEKEYFEKNNNRIFVGASEDILRNAEDQSSNVSA